jgi:CRISPR-associated protein Csb2
MAFAIVADLPLGTYRGAGPDGRPERIPSVARLHSALLCAAGFGPRAVESGPTSTDHADADADALRWLEDHPPDSVHIPALEVNAGGAIAYRDDGTFTKPPKSRTLITKKLAKAPDAGTAVDGQFVWIWTQDPPEPVRTVLEQLCPDVPYLGTTESPVRLIAVSGDDFRATHDLNPTAGLFTIGGTGVDRPITGRVDELSEAHHAASGAPPSAAKDRPTTEERSHSAVPPRKAVETAWYSPRAADTADVPWNQVIVIPMDGSVPEQDRVGWAVAAHRALIKMTGDGAPAMITGAYPEGTHRPANRIALHMFNWGMPAEVRDPSLLILVPSGTESADLDVLQRAVAGLSVLRGPGGRTRKLDTSKIRVVDGSLFWSPPAPGTIRLWRTVPAAIPETRGSRDSEWNFAHAALLSMGFVWKDHKDRLPRIAGRGDAYYRGLATAVSEAGVAVVHTKAVRTSDVDRYVHKVNEHAVVRPYTACLSLGSLAGSRTILAIGQSRHLGGGLLVPVDVAEGTTAGAVSLPAEGGA